jgi:hypothetical protein
MLETGSLSPAEDPIADAVDIPAPDSLTALVT